MERPGSGLCVVLQVLFHVGGWAWPVFGGSFRAAELPVIWHWQGPADSGCADRPSGAVLWNPLGSPRLEPGGDRVLSKVGRHLPRCMEIHGADWKSARTRCEPERLIGVTTGCETR